MRYQHRCDVCGLWLPSWWGRTCRRCEKKEDSPLALVRGFRALTGERPITASPYDSLSAPGHPSDPVSPSRAA